MGGLKALYSHCFLSLGFGDFRRLFVHRSQEAHKFLLQKHGEKDSITLAAVARYAMMKREAVHN